jgi:hypothetical protein
MKNSDTNQTEQLNETAVITGVLVPMTVFVFQIAEDYGYKNFMLKTLRYASLLKQDIKLEMFFCFKKEPKAEDYFNVNIPIDKLTEDDKKGASRFHSDILFYEDAKNKVMFDGFTCEVDNEFETILISENHRLIFRVDSIWCSNKENTIDKVEKVEDLIDFFNFKFNEKYTELLF